MLFTRCCCSGTDAALPVEAVTYEAPAESEALHSESGKLDWGAEAWPFAALEDACCGRARQKDHTAKALESAKHTHIRAAPSGNTNSPMDYVWLTDTLASIADGQASTLNCKDADSGRKPFSPVFVVLGACPSALAPMQAVVFCASATEIDFWYLKPCAEGKPAVEPATLSRNSSGAFKNDPGASRRVLQPIADLFLKSAAGKGPCFGIDRQGKSPRAFVQAEPSQPRLWLVAIWMEDWTSNPFASIKQVTGKLVYQKDPKRQEFYMQQYRVVGEEMRLLDLEELAGGPLPPASVKDLWEMP